MKSVIAIPALCLGFILVAADASAADITDLISSCDDCHGTDGVSMRAEIPTIGGFSAQAIIDSFAAYADETRPCQEVEFLESRTLRGLPAGEKSDMCKLTGELAEEEIKQLAEHYATKPFVPAKQDFDAALADAGSKVHGLECKKCHEDGGSSPDDDAGILAGQWMAYLETQFTDYASGEREMSKKMKVKMDKLSAADIKALLHYYASLQ